MNIQSKAQVIFGIEVSHEESEYIDENQNDFPNLFIYNEDDDRKIFGFLVKECRTFYNYSDSIPFEPLSSEKLQEISTLLKNKLDKDASYFLIAQCS